MPSPHSSSSHSSSSRSGSSSSGSSWGSSGSSWGSSRSSWGSSDSSWDSSDDSWFDRSSRDSRPSDGFMGKYRQGEPWDPDDGDRRLGATNEDTAGLWGLGARAAFLDRDRVSANPDLDAAPHRSYDRLDSGGSGSGNRRAGWILGGLVLLAVILIAVLVHRGPGRQDPGGEVVVTNAFGRVLSNPELFGETLYLKRWNIGGYRFTSDGVSYDKKLTWDSAEESYYDDESGVWLWYNTDVEPPLWQYWYEPISGDYSNYGWMEYEDGKWYIEESRGNWVLLPKKYDASALWYVETSTKTNKHGNSAPAPTFVYGDSEEDLKTIQSTTEEAIFDDSDEDLKSARSDTDEDLP